MWNRRGATVPPITHLHRLGRAENPRLGVQAGLFVVTLFVLRLRRIDATLLYLFTRASHKTARNVQLLTHNQYHIKMITSDDLSSEAAPGRFDIFASDLNEMSAVDKVALVEYLRQDAALQKRKDALAIQTRGAIV